MLMQLIYISDAKVINGQCITDVLTVILRQSRANNPRQGITGVLMHESGKFIQLLEGDENTVNQLYRLISKDPRHSNIVKVAERKVRKRSFPKWSMGFVKSDITTKKALSLLEGAFCIEDNIDLRQELPDDTFVTNVFSSFINTFGSN